MRQINTCRYELTETCVSAAKRASVRLRLEGEMPKTVNFGRNVQGRNIHLYGANRPGGEACRQGAKRRGAKRPVATRTDMTKTILMWHTG